MGGKKLRGCKVVVSNVFGGLFSSFTTFQNSFSSWYCWENKYIKDVQDSGGTKNKKKTSGREKGKIGGNSEILGRWLDVEEAVKVGGGLPELRGCKRCPICKIHYHWLDCEPHQ